MIIWVIVGIIAVFLIVSIIWDGQREERMAIFLNHLEGVDGVPYKDGISVRVQTEVKCLQLEHNKNEILLPFNQIVSVNIITWEKTIVKALNPMAEGIVGGLIGGHTMAVVSAIDAKGRTRSEKVKVENALEIRYHPNGVHQTIKGITFGEVASKVMIVQFAKTLCKYANLPGPNFVEPKPQGPQYL